MLAQTKQKRKKIFQH